MGAQSLQTIPKKLLGAIHRKTGDTNAPLTNLDFDLALRWPRSYRWHALILRCGVVAGIFLWKINYKRWLRKFGQSDKWFGRGLSQR